MKHPTQGASRLGQRTLLCCALAFWAARVDASEPPSAEVINTSANRIFYDLVASADGGAYVLGSAPTDIMGAPFLGPGGKFVARYSAQGTELWSTNLDSLLPSPPVKRGNRLGLPFGLRVDSAGNLLAVVLVKDAEAKPGTGPIGGPYENHAVLKLNPQGKVLWTVLSPEQGGNLDRHPAACEPGLGGSFHLMVPSTNGLSLTKHDAGGARLWATVIVAEGGVPLTSFGGLAVDGAGNSILTGLVDGKIFLAKYDTAGFLVWRRACQHGPADTVAAVRTTANNAIYLAGTTGSAGLDRDFLLAKFDAAGQELWSRAYHDPKYPPGSILDFSVDAAGNCYFTANGRQPFNTACLLMKYDSQGARLWASAVEGNNAVHSAQTLVTPSGSIQVVLLEFIPGVRGTSSSLLYQFDVSGNQLLAAAMTGQYWLRGALDTRQRLLVAGYKASPVSGGDAFFQGSTLARIEPAVPDFVEPAPGAEYPERADIALKVTRENTLASVEYLVIDANGQRRLALLTHGPFTWIWERVPTGVYRILARTVSLTGDTNTTSISLKVLAVPRLIPVLAGGKLVLSWQSADSGFSLEKTDNLDAPSWIHVEQAPVAEGALNVVRLNQSSGAGFFRLRRP